MTWKRQMTVDWQQEQKPPQQLAVLDIEAIVASCTRSILWQLLQKPRRRGTIALC
jgi:hypothetical protein